MSELPPDLLRLRTVVTYLRGELGRAERALIITEQQAALAAQRRPLPEPPACLIERGIGVGRLPVRVHASGCWDARKRCTGISIDEARRALAKSVQACPHFPIESSCCSSSCCERRGTCCARRDKCTG